MLAVKKSKKFDENPNFNPKKNPVELKSCHNVYAVTVSKGAKN